MKPDPDLSEALNLTHSMLARYVAWPSPESCDAVTLWAAHTWSSEACESTPRLVFRSAEKQSGKTRAQEVLECIVRDPLATANATVAAVFRSLQSRTPTIMLDEYDTIFGTKTARENAEDLRGLLNAGHRRNRPVLRCVGPQSEVREFPSFAPVCLAGIKGLPDTIEDRSIIIDMRRRAPGEHVASYRSMLAWDEAQPIRDLFESWRSRWVDKWINEVTRQPWYPPGIVDRRADCWESLLLVGEWAGDGWADRARQAATYFATIDNIASDQSVGITLLVDIAEVWPSGQDNVFTKDLVSRLGALDESPWGEWWLDSDGRPTTGAPNRLARELKHYGIRSSTVRVGSETGKGYRRDKFEDAWARYTPGDPSQASQGSQASDRKGSDVTASERVTAHEASQPPEGSQEIPRHHCDVTAVTDVAPFQEHLEDDYSDRYPELFGEDSQ